MWAKASFSISALYSHSQVIAREHGAESWHYGACVGPAVHQGNGDSPWGHKEVKEGGGKYELFRACCIFSYLLLKRWNEMASIFPTP